MDDIRELIDSVQSKPEEWPQDDDPHLPKWAVTVFLQHKDEAEAFIEAGVWNRKDTIEIDREAGRSFLIFFVGLIVVLASSEIFLEEQTTFFFWLSS